MTTNHTPMEPCSDTGPVRARGPVTDAERASVAVLHAQGWTRGAIARKLGRPASTVGKIAKAADLTWDRSRTAVAVAAKQVDNRARRAALIERAYELAAGILYRLEAENGYEAASSAANGKTVVTRVAVPPAHDVKALAGAFSTLTNSAVRMEAVDGGGLEVEHAKSMLGQLAAGIAVAAVQITAGEDGETDG